MILLSLNLRGIGGPLKAASLRWVLDSTKPNIVFFQETMVSDQKARVFAQRFRPSWVISAVSSEGSSSGLLVMWDPCFISLTPFLTCGGILLTGLILATKRMINLLNVYGLCLERRVFWTNLATEGLLSLKNLVIAGDLNLTLTTGESWGGSSVTCALSSFLSSLFQLHCLVDLQPDKLVPNWRNGRSGEDLIAKRLDMISSIRGLSLISKYLPYLG
jgi:hypothetical protein